MSLFHPHSFITFFIYNLILMMARDIEEWKDYRHISSMLMNVEAQLNDPDDYIAQNTSVLLFRVDVTKKKPFVKPMIGHIEVVSS